MAGCPSSRSLRRGTLVQRCTRPCGPPPPPTAHIPPAAGAAPRAPVGAFFCGLPQFPRPASTQGPAFRGQQVALAPSGRPPPLASGPALHACRGQLGREKQGGADHIASMHFWSPAFRCAWSAPKQPLPLLFYAELRLRQDSGLSACSVRLVWVCVTSAMAGSSQFPKVRPLWRLWPPGAHPRSGVACQPQNHHGNPSPPPRPCRASACFWWTTCTAAPPSGHSWSPPACNTRVRDE